MPNSLRGDLTKWCQEIQTGVYVGNVNAKIRERLWQRINENIGLGEASLVYNTNNELGYTFRTTRKDKEVIDLDGIPLMMSLYQENPKIKHGFSKAYRYHQAKIHSYFKPDVTKIPEFVALDLETTGLNPSQNQIISIGAVKKLNNELKTFYRLIKIDHEIPTNISKVTKITNRMLERDGISLKDAIIDLQYFIKDLPVIGYNLTFDERFLQIAIIKENLVQINNHMYDLLPIIKQVDSFVDNYKLQTILEKYNIKNKEPHNSLSDATATMWLADKLIKKGIFRL